MNKHLLRFLMAGMLTTGLTMLTIVSTAAAESGDEACSNRTLRGDYGFDIQAQLTFDVVRTLRGVAMTRFDGRGHLQQVDHVVISGFPPPAANSWNLGTGTYEINPDCTGTATINFADGRPSVTLGLVVVREGTEVHTVVDGVGPGADTFGTSVGIKRNSSR